MKLNKWVVVGTLVAAALGVGVTHQVADAGSDLDCSNVKKWSYDRSYKRGDQVWTPYSADYAHKHECILDKCQGGQNNGEPGSFSKAWKQLGRCKSRPSS